MKDQQCVLCGGEAFKEKRGTIFKDSQKERFEYCRGCGLISLEGSHWPKDQTSHYDDDYYTSDFKGHTMGLGVFAYRLPLLKKYIKEGSRVLEVGASCGDFLSLVKAQGYDVRGVEISNNAARIAKEQYDVSVDVGTLFDQDYKDGEFDAIISYQVFEHLPQPIEALREMKRILKPGGVLLLETPDPRCFDAKISKRYRKNIFDPPHHLYLFSPGLLKRALSENGFSPEHSSNTLSYGVVSAVSKAKGLLKKQQVSKKKKVTTTAADIKVPAFSKKKELLSRFFPGMKNTIVARRT